MPLLGFVPERSVRELFEGCDAAVLGRSDGGTSGSLVLALSMGLPAVVPDRDAYRELVDGGRAGWLFEPGDAASLSSALSAAASRPDVAGLMGTAAYRRAERASWREAAALTAQVLFTA